MSMETSLEVALAELVGRRDYEEKLTGLFLTPAGVWMELSQLCPGIWSGPDVAFLCWLPVPMESAESWRLVILADELAQQFSSAIYNYARLRGLHGALPALPDCTSF